MSCESTCHCGQAHGACATEFQYAVKLVCGEVAAATGGAPVAPGRYWTAINIHNPDKCRQAHFRWKVVVAKPLGQTVDVPVYQRPVVLDPDTALEIDCPQVIRTLPDLKFVKGYVVLESDVKLDVVAVYSGSSGSSAANSFHMERVPARCVPVCEDLVLPFNTGLAAWRTVFPGPSALAVPVTLNMGPLAGSHYISQSANDGASASVGYRIYELRFDLCFGFQPAWTTPIQVMVDDLAWVYVRQSGIPTFIGGMIPYNTLTTLPPNLIANALRPGANHLGVIVYNYGGPTGFALSGVLNVPRGKCPCYPLPIFASAPPSGDLFRAAETAEAPPIPEELFPRPPAKKGSKTR
ncbi:MAG TPA: hypothetical protein VF744_06110 [Beijerinckiaceae bacterium]|jgi:hypothetical protein